jgi:hypothetical protein
MRDAVTEESLKRNKKKRISIGEKIGVEKGAKERQPLWIINDDWGEKGQMDEGPPPSLPTRPIRRGKTQPWALFFFERKSGMDDHHRVRPKRGGIWTEGSPPESRQVWDESGIGQNPLAALCP